MMLEGCVAAYKYLQGDMINGERELLLVPEGGGIRNDGLEQGDGNF